MYGKLQFRLNIYESIAIALVNDSGMRYRDRRRSPSCGKRLSSDEQLPVSPALDAPIPTL